MRGDAARPDEDVIAATVKNDAGESTSTLSALTLSTNGNSDTLAGTTTMRTTSGEDNVGGHPKGSTALVNAKQSNANGL